jgi:hypothetical protein
VSKNWKRSDIEERSCFARRYVYKIKRSAELELLAASRWTDPKFDMEKGKDYDENFSPTPGIAIAGIIT